VERIEAISYWKVMRGKQRGKVRDEKGTGAPVGSPSPEGRAEGEPVEELSGGTG
jgi:hypothetical protein